MDAGKDPSGQAPGAPVRRLAGAAIRQAPVAAIALAAIWLLSERMAEVDPGALAAALRQTGWAGWLGAMALTAVSFRAVGRYDALVLAELAQGKADGGGDGGGPAIPARAARRAGAAAIAASQVLGLGVVSGALVRWRLLPGLGLAAATRQTVAVALSFLSAWAVLLCLTLAIFPLAPGLPSPLADLATAGLAALAAALWAGRVRALPALPFALRLVALAAADTVAAALALWVLLPGAVDIGFAGFLAVYLLALGAALLSGLPGGVGAFEAVMIAALPGAAPEPLLAAILAFRAVYYALPAIWAGYALWRGPRGAGALPATGWRRARRLVARARRAEAGLARQAGHGVIALGNGRAGWVVARAGGSLAAIGDPLGAADPAVLLRLIARRARAAGLRPCLYKAGARTAAAARRAGWKVFPVAEELWLCPLSWTDAGHRQARLRRKLRRADAAGVTIGERAPGDTLPLAVMGQIARGWAARNGGERGLSMGRFSGEYLSCQQVFLARAGGRLVAFATFHRGRGEWTLDLMRQAPDCPDGTMQALIGAAIASARRSNIPRLSLAAVPYLPPDACPGPRAPAALWRRLARPASGLRQFKAAFGPKAETLYVAAPSWIALLAGVADLCWAIRFPPPLCRPAARMNGIHHQPDQDEIESRPPSWHIGPQPAPIRAAVAERHSDERSSYPPA